ncbi:hypothetical protein [Nocardia harenae]|uniref:hypothetical protein n=1 Tax=Nocardia harenae TaxID=358707 RepID=UPI00082DB8D0|nr:hypothetical protein [Nocardia harenae]
MPPDRSSGFAVDDLTVGPYAHGFGSTADGHPFAFRTVRSTLFVEIYRHDADLEVPGPEDVVAVADTPVTDIDLDDPRSVTALVRDLLPTAVPARGTAAGEPTIVRALLGRLGAVIDGR